MVKIQSSKHHSQLHHPDQIPTTAPLKQVSSQPKDIMQARTDAPPKPPVNPGLVPGLDFRFHATQTDPIVLSEELKATVIALCNALLKSLAPSKVFEGFEWSLNKPLEAQATTMIGQLLKNTEYTQTRLAKKGEPGHNIENYIAIHQGGGDKPGPFLLILNPDEGKTDKWNSIYIFEFDATEIETQREQKETQGQYFNRQVSSASNKWGFYVPLAKNDPSSQGKGIGYFSIRLSQEQTSTLKSLFVELYKKIQESNLVGFEYPPAALWQYLSSVDLEIVQSSEGLSIEFKLAPIAERKGGYEISKIVIPLIIKDDTFEYGQATFVPITLSEEQKQRNASFIDDKK